MNISKALLNSQDFEAQLEAMLLKWTRGPELLLSPQHVTQAATVAKLHALSNKTRAVLLNSTARVKVIFDATPVDHPYFVPDDVRQLSWAVLPMFDRPQLDHWMQTNKFKINAEIDGGVLSERYAASHNPLDHRSIIPYIAPYVTLDQVKELASDCSSWFMQILQKTLSKDVAEYIYEKGGGSTGEFCITAALMYNPNSQIYDLQQRVLVSGAIKPADWKKLAVTTCVARLLSEGYMTLTKR